jgi:hypothetical protein
LFSSCDQEKITTLLLLIAGAQERKNLLLPASILLVIIIIPTLFAMAIKHKNRTGLFLWTFFFVASDTEMERAASNTSTAFTLYNNRRA